MQAQNDLLLYTLAAEGPVCGQLYTSDKTKMRHLKTFMTTEVSVINLKSFRLLLFWGLGVPLVDLKQMRTEQRSKN